MTPWGREACVHQWALAELVGFCRDAPLADVVQALTAWRAEPRPPLPMRVCGSGEDILDALWAAEGLTQK